MSVEFWAFNIGFSHHASKKVDDHRPTYNSPRPKDTSTAPSSTNFDLKAFRRQTGRPGRPRKDSKKDSSSSSAKKRTKVDPKTLPINHGEPRASWDNRRMEQFVFANENETPSQIAKKLKLKSADIVKYNKSKYPGFTAHARLMQGTSVITRILLLNAEGTEFVDSLTGRSIPKDHPYPPPPIPVSGAHRRFQSRGSGQKVQNAMQVPNYETPQPSRQQSISSSSGQSESAQFLQVRKVALEAAAERYKINSFAQLEKKKMEYLKAIEQYQKHIQVLYEHLRVSPTAQAKQGFSLEIQRCRGTVLQYDACVNELKTYAVCFPESSVEIPIQERQEMIQLLIQNFRKYNERARVLQHQQLQQQQLQQQREADRNLQEFQQMREREIERKKKDEAKDQSIRHQMMLQQHESNVRNKKLLLGNQVKNRNFGNPTQAKIVRGAYGQRTNDMEIDEEGDHPMTGVVANVLLNIRARNNAYFLDEDEFNPPLQRVRLPGHFGPHSNPKETAKALQLIGLGSIAGAIRGAHVTAEILSNFQSEDVEKIVKDPQQCYKLLCLIYTLQQIHIESEEMLKNTQQKSVFSPNATESSPEGFPRDDLALKW
eukprot:CAMPEP_0114511980 /NCGR_PEP_ID=MMETSP0109-20121206/14709_1 /TAXON_ID=29199 /ORGANISM="Chlorarachnion reptans, Strain CCCM449" /LENGTH=598 /DNA_ID=CAMNT_0001691589 /DNA_START=178 /DNA_END=1971 /DNA_ORIENTATION=-